MISVEFKMDPGDNIYDYLEACAGTMPWLEYLHKHRIDLTIREIWDPAPHQKIVTFEFELPPEKETFYRLKYRDGL